MSEELNRYQWSVRVTSNGVICIAEHHERWANHFTVTAEMAFTTWSSAADYIRQRIFDTSGAHNEPKL